MTIHRTIKIECDGCGEIFHPRGLLSGVSVVEARREAQDLDHWRYVSTESANGVIRHYDQCGYCGPLGQVKGKRGVTT